MKWPSYPGIEPVCTYMYENESKKKEKGFVVGANYREQQKCQKSELQTKGSSALPTTLLGHC